MFQVAVKSEDKKHRLRVQKVSVERLPEAEKAALKLASKVFNGTDIILVHIGDLEYEVHELFEPIGQVKITTG